MGQGAEKKETLMGKLRLEASWCSSTRNSARVQLELDVVIVVLLVKMALLALAV